MSCEICNLFSIYWRDAKRFRNCFVKCKHQTSCLSNQLYVFCLIKSLIIIEDIQFVFITRKRVNCYNRRDENTIIQIDCRREIDFNISQNDENNVDSNFDLLHIEISIKHVLQNIIVAINNQFTKRKKKRFKDTKNRSRIDLLSRVDFNVLSYATRSFAFVFLFSRNVKRVSKQIVARMKRTIKQKQKIEQSNQKNEINWIKKTFEKLNDDKFVRIFQFDTFSLNQSIESTSISSSESISINRNVRRKNERRKTRRRDERSLNLN